MIMEDAEAPDESLILTRDVPQDETFKILISSDNHLGVYDSNPIRENDSFVTFEEILTRAQTEDVDFVLLGGDLFHDNRPKPATFQRAVDMIQKFCLGSKPALFEYLGDPRLDFSGQEEPCVNYYNPNVNIGIPIFTIHGNHDDPIGSKKTSVIDHLAAVNLVNHFGTYDNFNHIEIRPVLLRKGGTFLAIYGLGAMKDERLYRLMLQHKVTFLRPTEEGDKWFNIFVIHQNRVKHGPTNYIPERFIPDFFDLVLWGHEHECKPDPDFLNNEGDKNTFVIQMGSSVATQLQPGEAIDKYTVVLHIHKKQFKVSKFKLETVRPFLIDDLKVSDILKDRPSNVERRVEDYIDSRMNQLISDASDKLTGHPNQPIDPLIRLRVFHNDEIEFFNPIRYSMKYLNKVANNDVVVLKKLKEGGEGDGEQMDFEDIQGMIMQINEDANDLGDHVEDIVEKHFIKERAKGQNGIFLQVLSERGLSESVRAAAEKDDLTAVKIVVDAQIEKTMEHLRKKMVTEETIMEEINQFRELRLANVEREIQEVRDALRGRRNTSNGSSNGGGGGSVSDDDNVGNNEGDDVVMMMGEEEEVEEDDLAPPPSSSSRGGRGRGRGSNNSSRTTTTPSSGRGRGRGRGTSSSTPSTSTRGRGRAKVTLPVKVKNRGNTAPSVHRFDDDSMSN